MEVAGGGSFSIRPNWLRLALLVFSLALSGLAHAQSTASLNGTVMDPTGAGVPNAQVVVKNEATGVASKTQTDGAGAYLFPSLAIGSYRIEVTANGFQMAVLTDLKLEVATSVTENITLKVGEVSEQVLITAEPALVETTTTSIGQVINDKTVQEIPLNGRHFVDLSLLTPGTVTPPANGFLTAPLRGQGSFAINTAGQ
ncbi:MAG: carboxypeptidase-like regulatory domain-containing protein, partial [Candidatus Acidiferrum sp.]